MRGNAALLIMAMTMSMGNFDHYVYGNFDHFACVNKVHVLTPEPLSEGTVHVSPFLLQIDIFGKLLK